MYAMNNPVPIADFWVGQGDLVMIAGPCVIESADATRAIARTLQVYARELHLPLIFKASYDKANRTSVTSFRGPGLKKGLEILARVKDEVGLPVLSDVHQVTDVAPAAEVFDVLQIPAFLCRQTELLVAAGKTGKAVNIKKGQFASAESMKFAVQKVLQTDNSHIMLTERGTTFGYSDLVVDFRNIPEMQGNGVPVIVDVTHSLQQPNQASGITGGRPDLIETIAKAAVAVGVDGIFLETHPDPGNAKSDGANMLQLDLLENLLEKLVKIRRAIY